MIQVRKAKIEEIDRIMEFIRKEWKEDHILGTNKEFFSWMYVRNGEVNFNIAIDESTNQIYGINGFVLFNDTATPDIIGSMWKVIKSDNPALGLLLGEYAWTRWNPRGLFSIGLNKKAAKIEMLYGSEVAFLEHWYYLGERTEYRVARIATVPEKKDILDREIPWCKINDMAQFQEIISDEMLQKNAPYRDYSYVNYRYFSHPIYQYHMYGVEDAEGLSKGIFVCREVEHEGARICKIVDFFGDDKVIASSHNMWNSLVSTRQYEYIDFYCYGIPREYMQQAGFSLLTKDSENIIPNYFEPFEQSNVDIRTVVPIFPSFHMYRGDGDQDRPSFS